MFETKEVKLALIVTLCMGLLLGYYFAGFINIGTVDVDCLLDNMENAMKEDTLQKYSDSYAKGTINEQWTIEQFENMYWFKHPKTRWALKTVITMELKKCQS